MKAILPVILPKEENICSQAQSLVGTKTVEQTIKGIIDMIKGKLKENIKDSLILSAIDDYIDKYSPQIKEILLCICPNLHYGSSSSIDNPCSGKSNQQANANMQVESVNFKTLGIFALLLLAIFLIPMIVIAFQRSWSVTKRVIIILGFITVMIGGLFVYNRPILFGLVFWHLTIGNYRGKSDLIAGIQISADIFFQGKTVTINELKCTVGDCPNDLIKACNKQKLTINTANKTDFGYPLCGECLTSIQKLIKKDDTQLRCFYVVRKSDDYYVQIDVKINVLEPLIQIKLQSIDLMRKRKQT